MSSNWFLDKVTASSFEKDVEVASRFDGKFNLWRKVVEFSKKEGFTSYWEVIGVYDTEKAGQDAKEKLRAA